MCHLSIPVRISFCTDDILWWFGYSFGMIITFAKEFVFSSASSFLFSRIGHNILDLLSQNLMERWRMDHGRNH